MSERVFPPGLNYADIKPEAIDNQLRLIRFTPVATVEQAVPNNVVRFQLQSNGFLDPYSTYLKFTVRYSDYERAIAYGDGLNAGGQRLPGRCFGAFVDRSAHSFINRLVIRSQGTELERIDEYDVAAALINDVHYSNEQQIQHAYEGFPKNEANYADLLYSAARGDAVADIPSAVTYFAYNNFKGRMISDLMPQTPASTGRTSCDQFFGVMDTSIPSSTFNESDNGGLTDDAALTAAIFGTLESTPHDNLFDLQHTNEPSTHYDIINQSNARPSITTFATGDTRTFCIPIYSGILGILMPDKRLLPLSMMPLEVEFTINPHALYTCGQYFHTGDIGANVIRGAETTRNYVVTKMEIYAHMFFFEQNVHRAIEAAVAQAGLFLHFNSFRLGPVGTNSGGAGSTINQYAQINVHDKSINSIHTVFMYTGYQTRPYQRKLHFVSHRLKQLQIRNGTDLMPSEPLMNDVPNGNALVQTYGYTQFMVELYKAWNKMHSPALDSGITMFNFQYDRPLFYSETSSDLENAATDLERIGCPYENIVRNNVRLGRAQYAISLEGEQLGANKMIISGKQGQIPFDINQIGTKMYEQVSQQLIFVRADYVLYIRPDLVVTVLGR